MSIAAVAGAARRWSELPGPPGLPLLGQLLRIEVPRLHRQMEAWADEYGPLYRLRLGPRRILAVADHELIAALLRDRPEGWRRPRNMAAAIADMRSGGVFSAEGEAWRTQRKLVMAAFDPGHLKRFFPALRRVGERLRAQLHAAAAERRSLELQPLLMRFTIDVTAGLALGLDINTLEQPQNRLRGHLDQVFPMLMRRITMPVPYWRYLRLPADRAFERHLDAVEQTILGYIDQARERVRQRPELQERPENLLEALLAARDEQGRPLDPTTLYGNVVTMLLAGEDTTANTLAWALYHLKRSPASWAALVAEVDAALGDAPLPEHYEQARELPYVEACIQETMRLRPVAPLMFLESLRDTRLGDVAVQRNDFVICVMRRGATDRALQDDAPQFRPERWLEGERAGPAHALLKASMPFGAGPRMCPGRALALLEMKLVLSLLARGFELDEVGCPDGSEPAECLAFTMFPEGLRMRLRSRY